MRKTSLQAMCALAVALAVWCHPAAAHPHVFVEHSMKLEFGSKGEVALRMTWIFDEMYSEMLRSDYVKSKKAILPASDIANIKENAFSNLAGYGYFLSIKLNDKPFKVVKVTDFTVHFAGEKAVYEFAVPLDTVAGARTRLEIGAFDPEYFVDYALMPRDFMTILHGEPFHAACSAKRDVSRSTAYGPVNSDLLTCNWGKE